MSSEERSSAIKRHSKTITEEIRFKLDPEHTPEFELSRGIAKPVYGVVTRVTHQYAAGNQSPEQRTIVLENFHNGQSRNDFFFEEDLHEIPEPLLSDILGLLDSSHSIQNGN